MNQTASIRCRVLTAFASTMTMIVAVPGSAQTLIFSDGFETGDTSRWSSAILGTPSCVAGPVPPGLFQGALGAVPGGSRADVACVEVRNDRARDRHEVAYSSIPIASGLGLLDTDELVLVGPGSTRMAAQFDVISRWGGPADDTALPIRWLELSVPATVASDATTRYSLVRYDVPPPAPNDGFAVAVSQGAGTVTVDTGVATFVLGEANPALLDSISIALADDGIGRVPVYAHTPGAGPRMVFNPGGGAVTLDTSVAGRVVVDDLRVLESGPVKAVATLRGHFSAAGGASLCTAGPAPYERFGYTATATFTRASRDVELRYEFRNECSDASGADWVDDAVTVDQASWELPFTMTASTGHWGAAGAVFSTGVGATTTVEVAQDKGAGVPWLRRARVRVGGIQQEASEAFDRPIVAASDPDLIASLQLAWMRYREPQAIVRDGSTLSLRVISEPLVVGEGKALERGPGRPHSDSDRGGRRRRCKRARDQAAGRHRSPRARSPGPFRARRSECDRGAAVPRQRATVFGQDRLSRHHGAVPR